MSSVHTNVIPFPEQPEGWNISSEVVEATQPAKSIVSKIPVTLNLSPKQLAVIAEALANDDPTEAVAA